MDVKIKVFPSQEKALVSNNKSIALVCPRGFGKSFVNGLWCIYKLITDPKAPGLLLAPTHAQANELSSILAEHCETIGLEYTVNKAPNWVRSKYSDHKGLFSVKIKNNIHSYIRIASAEKPDNIRGLSVCWVSIDEAAMVREELIDIVLPCLRGMGIDFNYQTLLTTTPRGMNNSWFYKRFIETGTADIIRASALENKYVWTPERIEEAKESMTELMFRQEILCEFVDRDMNNMAYAFDKNIHIKDKKIKNHKLCLSMDQNTNPLCVGIFETYSDEVHMRDEIIQQQANLEKLITEIHKKINKPQTLYLYGDRSGSNKTWISETTYYDQLKAGLERLGYRLIDNTNTSNPSVFDSNEVFNRLLEKNKFTISPRCKTAIDHLQKAVWKDGEYVMNKKVFDAHCYDLIRYICYKTATKPKATSFNLPVL